MRLDLRSYFRGKRSLLARYDDVAVFGTQQHADPAPFFEKFRDVQSQDDPFEGSGIKVAALPYGGYFFVNLLRPKSAAPFLTPGSATKWLQGGPLVAAGPPAQRPLERRAERGRNSVRHPVGHEAGALFEVAIETPLQPCLFRSTQP